jgi:hypothetical protein
MPGLNALKRLHLSHFCPAASDDVARAFLAGKKGDLVSWRWKADMALEGSEVEPSTQDSDDADAAESNIWCWMGVVQDVSKWNGTGAFHHVLWSEGSENISEPLPKKAAVEAIKCPIENTRRRLLDRAIQPQSLRQDRSRFERLETFRIAMRQEWSLNLFAAWLGQMEIAGYREAEGFRAALAHCSMSLGRDVFKDARSLADDPRLHTSAETRGETNRLTLIRSTLFRSAQYGRHCNHFCPIDCAISGAWHGRDIGKRYTGGKNSRRGIFPPEVTTK